MPYGYDPILTSFTSITTSSTVPAKARNGPTKVYGECLMLRGQSGHSPHRWRHQSLDGANCTGCGDYAPDALPRTDCTGRAPAGLGRFRST